MCLQTNFELHLIKQESGASTFLLRVRLYTQSLKPTLQNFVKQEHMTIKSISLHDCYIEYIFCGDNLVRAMRRLEDNLTINSTYLSNVS